MKTGIELITEKRQKDVYNQETAKDVLCCMASVYALPESYRRYICRQENWPVHWPIAYSIFNYKTEERIEELKKAGALIAAEIDKLQKVTKL